MEHDKYDSIGYVAGFFLCITLLPQIHKVYTLKRANQLSIKFISISLITCILFLAYGILNEALPLIISNIITTIQNIILLILKLKYDILSKNRIQNELNDNISNDNISNDNISNENISTNRLDNNKNNSNVNNNVNSNVNNKLKIFTI